MAHSTYFIEQDIVLTNCSTEIFWKVFVSFEIIPTNERKHDDAADKNDNSYCNLHLVLMRGSSDRCLG
jgi:hypothetical protein